MLLDEIGFYALTENRAMTASIDTPMHRCELLLTDKCNFKCPYCRELREDCKGTIPLERAKEIIDLWSVNGLVNVRLSGGEPTLYPHLIDLVNYIKSKGVEHIAISTNGSADLAYYKALVKAGVNDFSISLDACCSSFGEKMCGGIKGVWKKVTKNIHDISKLTYVTLGIVFVEETMKTSKDTIEFAHSLGVSDIRIISSAQYNQAIKRLNSLDTKILDVHPILRYRVNNYANDRNVRGLKVVDAHHCGLVIDDSAIAGDYHFPCIIYLREHGKPIGRIGKDMRLERYERFKNHDCFNDPICKKNCLDVCIDYNNKFRYHRIGDTKYGDFEGNISA